MQGLLLRLSTLDADAESAVRVIAYFDSLLRDHVSVPVLLKATARLTQCPVGLLDAATGRRTRVRADGSADTPAVPSSARELSSGLGAVWMEREGPAHGLDEIVLERYAAAAEVTLERAAALARTGQDPALVELVLSDGTGEAERARALRLLGLDPATPLQALAIALPDQGLAAGLRAMGHHVRAATIGDTAAVLVATPWRPGCPASPGPASAPRCPAHGRPSRGPAPAPRCGSPARTTGCCAGRSWARWPCSPTCPSRRSRACPTSGRCPGWARSRCSRCAPCAWPGRSGARPRPSTCTTARWPPASPARSPRWASRWATSRAHARPPGPGVGPAAGEPDREPRLERG
ncbi:hypothetical protein ACFQ0B_73240 [Nonomuraea thailandensis]